MYFSNRGINHILKTYQKEKRCCAVRKPQLFDTEHKNAKSQQKRQKNSRPHKLNNPYFCCLELKGSCMMFGFNLLGNQVVI